MEKPSLGASLSDLLGDWWVSGKLLFAVVGVVAGVMLERHVLHKDVPGFKYQTGLLFDHCYELRTRAAIGECLDNAYAAANELPR